MIRFTKLFSNRYLRLLVLLAAMAGAYGLGRTPGPLARWEGNAPNTWRNLLSKTTALPETSASDDAAPYNPDGSKKLTAQEAFDSIARLGDLPVDDGREKYFAAMMDLLDGMNPKELIALFKIYGEQTASADHESEFLKQYSIIRRLIDKDPAQTLALIASEPVPELRRSWYEVAVGSLAGKNPHRALQILAQIPSEYIKYALQHIGDIASERRFETGPHGKIYSLDSGRIPDPAGAAAFVLSLPPGRERNQAIQAVASGWSENDKYSDPEAAMKLLLTLPPDERDFDIVMRKFAETNPALAATYFDQITDAAQRAEALEFIVREWSNGVDDAPKPLRPGDPAAALAWLIQHASGPELVANFDNMYPLFMDENPAPVIAEIIKIQDPRIRVTAINKIAERWGEDNPQAALEWVRTQPNADTTDITNTLITVWSSKDLTIAAAIAQNSPDLAALQAAFPKSDDPYWNYDHADAQTKLAFAGTLPDGNAKNEISLMALSQIAEKDFPSAWNQAANLQAGDARDYVMQSLLASRLAKDPAQAVPLLEQFSPGPALLESTQSLAIKWVQQDPRAMSEWVTTLPVGDVRDTATVQLIAEQVKKNPAEVITWANTLNNPATRAAQLQTVLTAWMKKDPAAALDAARAVNLPARQRAALLQSLAEASAKNAGTAAP